MGRPTEGETRKSRKANTAPFQGRYDAFLARLIAAREESGLTQRDVGKRLGMSYTFATKSESGDRRLDVMELIRLADLYGKPPEFFLKPE